MTTPHTALYCQGHERVHIKKLLTSDNVLKKGELYDADKPNSSTKADDYRDWGVLSKSPALKPKTLTTSIDFGSHTSEKCSTQKSDYNNKYIPKVPSCKPANTLNITDLDPAYQTDKSANTSSYAAQFDQHSLAKHQSSNKVVIHGTGNPVTNYLRATHFTLGSDPTELKTEAQVAYSAVETSSNSKSTAAAERAQQDKCNNHVFRNGDFNRTKGPDNKTVSSMSFAGAPSNQKGYDHIVNSRANIKMGSAKFAISRRLYNYLREKFQNPRDPCQVNLRQAFALFDKSRTGFISYESLSSVLSRILEPHEQETAGEIISLFDTNKDGKIDYLEFENFLNQKFPDVEKEESLYNESYKPSLLEGATKPRAAGYSPVDGKYHTKTHFKFGEKGENAESLYKSTFGGEKKLEKRHVAKPLARTQVLPVEPDHLKTAASIQRQDFGNHSSNLSKITSEKSATIQANKSIHENASFEIGRDDDEGKDLRTQSLAASSYQTHQLPQRSRKNKGFETQWKHLTTEDTLPDHSQGLMVTEQADAYKSSGTSALGDCSTNEYLRSMRVADEKTSHLSFGTDSNRGNVTEMAVEFQAPKDTCKDCRPAGITAGHIPQHEHIQHIDNTAEAGTFKGGMVTTMKSDYRTHDVGNKRSAVRESIQPSHYFHMDNSTVTPGTTTHQDFTHPVDIGHIHSCAECAANVTPGTMTQHDFAHPVQKLLDTSYQTVAST